MQIQGSKIKMAPKRPMLLQKMINEQRRRRRLLQESLAIATARRRLLLKTCLLVLLLIFKGKCSTERVCHRSCRRLLRANTGWWRMVWESYSDLSKHFGSIEVHSTSHYHAFGIDWSEKLSLKNQSPLSSVWLYACIDLEEATTSIASQKWLD